MSFCYNIPVEVYHGDLPEFQKLNTNYKVCKDGQWDEKDKKLQISLTLDNQKKRLSYDTKMEGTALVMEKKSDFVF